MKFSLYFFVFIFISVFGYSQVNPQWARYPSISPDGSTIVFTYKGNLFRVASTGGDATQLTFHEAHDFSAVWSKDGQVLAFASDRYGNFDVFTMDAKGGPATRITYHSANETPYSFSSDDTEVLFGAARQDAVAHRQYPTGAQPELYAVTKNGGRVRQVLTIPMQDVQVNQEGGQYLYHDKKGYENEFRKHHVSAITRDIWIYDVKTDTHKMITSFKGEDRNPVYGADENTIYYLSEESGTFNVHKLMLDNPQTNDKLTNFTLHPIRSLSIGNGTMAFTYDGELYTLKDGEKAKKLTINIRTQDGSNIDKFVSINGDVQEMDISPNGKEIAFISRGEVFITSIENSLTKRITNTPEQERFVKFTHDGKAIAYAREEQGKWNIYQSKKLRKEEPLFYGATLIKEEVLITSALDNYLPEFSPDGKKMAFIEGRRTLKVMDLKTRSVTTLLTPKDLYHMYDGDQYFKWSPDSKWVLMNWSPTMSNGEVLLLAADGSKRVNLTESGYYDFSPKWVNNGKQMLWFANRDGLKSYATSGRSQADVYSMFFTEDSWNNYRMSKEEYELNKQIQEADKAKKEGKSEDNSKKKRKEKEKNNDTLQPIKFDWEDLKERKTRMTIHSSQLADAVLSKDGEKLYYLAQFEKGFNLWETELRTKNTKKLIALGANLARLQWDKKQENLFVLSDGSIFKVDLKGAKTKAVKVKSEILLDSEAERRSMFDHIWLRTNAIFYHSNFHGVDWDLMRKEYEKYLPHLGNSNEFSEMISELLGELNVSHAGGRYAKKMPNADATASLGVFMDYNHKGNGIKIAEIINGGPLDRASLNIEKGMTIEKINGETILAERDVARYLNRKAGKFVLLDVVDDKGQTNKITIKPISLGEENTLLYKRWVKTNEKEVEKRSNGVLGYVHIPGMSDEPYRSIYDRMMGKFSDKKAVIVDTRFNGGGDLVADLAMFFTGVDFISYETESRKVGGEPTSRWTKPTLAMFNESMYSDGHCFASGYTDLKIGKTVGMPVPGTCSFAGWERLPNGGVWGVVPVSAKNKAGEWMENNETNPDIIVKNSPDLIDKGRDQQLERSIDELMIEEQ